MNRALAEAAEARVDEVLPAQEELHELLGFPAHASTMARADQVVRRGGRPAGARNKRLDQVARVVRERFGDVLLRQVAVATMPLADLIALGVRPLEALQEQRLSATAVLPYIEQRRPLAVDVSGRQAVHLTINLGGEETQQDQGVVEGLVVELDGAELDAARKALMAQGNAGGGQLIEDQAGAAGVPASARATPGGAVFAAVAGSHAPATVVSPAPEVSQPTQTQDPAGPGVGGGQ